MLLPVVIVACAHSCNAMYAAPPWGDPQPDVYAKPNAVQFADVLVGEESDWQDVVVGNAGPGLLEIASVSLDGDTHFELDAGSVASD